MTYHVCLTCNHTTQEHEGHGHGACLLCDCKKMAPGKEIPRYSAKKLTKEQNLKEIEERLEEAEGE